MVKGKSTKPRDGLLLLPTIRAQKNYLDSRGAKRNLEYVPHSQRHIAMFERIGFVARPRPAPAQNLTLPKMIPSSLRLSHLVAVLVASVAPLHAQTNATVSANRATFFSEPNYKGEALTVEAGASVPSLDQLLRSNQQPWTYAIVSIRIEGAAKATIYSEPRFAGDQIEITRNVADLYSLQRTSGGTWDHSIASIVVTGTGPTAPPPQMPPPTIPQSAPVVVQQAPPVVVQQPPPGQVVVVQQQPPPPTVVVVPARPAPPPPTVIVREPPRPRLDRRTADMMVTRAYREVLNRAPDPEGLATYRQRLMYEGWTERQIFEQLQRSGEARGVNADETIRKIYREVLGRDPDPNGLAHYRAKWRDGWTQGQIRDDLQRSKEGREGHIRSVITRAYRDLLNREPDPGGYATYEKAMRERGYTERDVRNALMSGDEYKKLHPRGR
jgi:hypothetical protein